MRESIYFPTFEIGNTDWLKFALLYLKKLNPIIPESGDQHLSDKYKKIYNETDLIKVHRPDYNEGNLATLDAIDAIERVLRHPEAFIDIFKNKKYLEEWRTPANQKFTLFREKYSDYWGYFCIENGLGHHSAHGISVSRDIANIYMTILAQCIADSEGMSPITDNQLLYNYSLFTRQATTSDSKVVKAAKCEINLQLPKNISELQIDDVIKHRNRPNFMERQKAFHDEFETFLEKAESGKTKEFENSLGSAWADFSDEVVQIGTGSLAFGIGVWLMVQSGGTAIIPAWEKLAGGAALTVGSTISIRNTWQNTKTKRLARRYLADLKNLP